MTATVMAGIHWQALRLWWRVCRSCVASRVTAWANARPTGRDGRPDRFGDGTMSMVTQWAKTAFLSGLGA